MRKSSLEAYEGIKPKISNHHKEILKSMRLLNKPSISKEISMKCSLGYHATARRLSELERMNLVEVVGRDEKVKYKPMLWALIKKSSL